MNEFKQKNPFYSQKRDSEFFTIVQQLFDEKGIEQKSEIPKTVVLSVLKTLAVYIKEIGLTQTANILINFIDNYLRYQVSKNRLGRKEIVEILHSIGEKLIPNENKEMDEY